MKKVLSLILILSFSFLAACEEKERTIPFDRYNIVKKQIIIENSTEGSALLSVREKRAARLFRQYMREYINKNRSSTQLFSKLKPDITKSNLFQMIRKMPKGANLHVHAPVILPAEKLYDLAAETKNTYVYWKKGKKQGKLQIFDPAEVPDGFIPFNQAKSKGLTKEKLLSLWHLHSPDYSWFQLRDIYYRLTSFINANPDVYKAYYKAVFQDAADDNIDHMEIRMNFPLFKDKASKKTPGAPVFKEAYLEFKKDHPDFSVKVIYTVAKRKHKYRERILRAYHEMLEIKKQTADYSDLENPVDFIVGFDLAGNEDNSLSLTKFVPDFEVLYNQGHLRDLYLHAGESRLPLSSNIVDAYLLKSRRVGHGLNLYRYPQLTDKFAEEKIPLEIAPISNQMLGFVRDFRLHPAVEYMRRGIPIVLGSDDPTLFGNDGLSYDFFVAAVFWNLSLGDIKQLCLNSIQYSALSDAEKTVLLNQWITKWDQFIDQAVKTDNPNRKKVN